MKKFYSILSEEEKVKFLQQVRLLDLVQRSPDGRIVTFFDLDDLNNESWPEHILFDDRSENIILTTLNLKFSYSDEVLKVKCKINFQFGGFFGLGFNVPNQKIFNVISSKERIRLSSFDKSV